MRKSNLFIIFSFLSIPYFLLAQNKQAKVDIPVVQIIGLDEKTVIDYANMRFYYAFNATDINDIESYLDLGMLQIGSKYTKYSSSFLAHSDSLVSQWQKENEHKRAWKSWIDLHGRMAGLWSEYQYSEFVSSNSQITEWAVMPRHHERDCARYSEPYPLMKWTLSKETMEICGYKCQKATCHFRGRDFIAWFAPDILVRKGPWKFGGLPGLIMKVSDKDNIYSFECVRIEKGKFPITQYPEKYFPMSTREKVYKFQVHMNERYGEIFASTWRKDFYEYDPLELE